MARTHVTPEEMQVQAVMGQKHKAASLLSATVVITPSPGRRIIVQTWQLKTDRGSSPNLTITATGSDTVTWRAVTSAQINAQGFPYFVAADDQPVTFTLGGSGGTYADLVVGYIEA